MAKLAKPFSSADVSTASDEILPPDDYEMMVVETNINENKKGTGQYLRVVLQTLNPDFDGKRVYDYINIVHQNEKVEKIAERQLAELCNACGILELEDTEELHDTPIIVRIDVDSGNEQFGPSNRVKKYIAQ